VITTAFKESHPAACEKGSIAAGVDHEGIAKDAYPLREFTYNETFEASGKISTSDHQLRHCRECKGSDTCRV
jgi:hypothetical protein